MTSIFYIIINITGTSPDILLFHLTKWGPSLLCYFCTLLLWTALKMRNHQGNLHISQKTKCTINFLLDILFVFIIFRKPKLFFASTLYTSTTISTSAVCFVPSFFTSSAILGCRKKKQLSFLEKDDVKTVDYSINPTSLNEAKDVDTPLVRIQLVSWPS